MKILVTGATGFIGNHVVSYLLQEYPDVTVVASSSSEAKAKQYDWFTQVHYKEFDLAAPLDPTTDYFEFFGKPDKLMHLAWEGLPNYKELFHFEKNLLTHYQFLKHLIGKGLKDITVTGTCSEYGMQEGSLKETMTSDPVNPYGLAKDALRRFLEQLKTKQEFTLKWARLFYMYGKGQFASSLTSQLDQALLRGDEIFNMSGGEQLRDYLPVETVAEYLVKIALQNEVTGIINCSSGVPISVKSFILEYLKKQGGTISFNFGYYPYPDYETMGFWGDNTRLLPIIKTGN